MPYRIWITVFFPTPLNFRYHLHLSVLFLLKESLTRGFHEFFSCINFPLATEYPMRIISNYIDGVVDTGEQFLGGVMDTREKF